MSKYERLSRLFKIASLVKSQKSLHRRELAEQCEVSIRTIQRDIDTLCYAGVPIYRSENGYELMPGFFMPPVNLSLEEALNLIIAARASYKNKEEDCRNAIESAISKVISVLPGDTQNKLEQALSEIEADGTEFGEVFETNASYLELVEA